MPKEKFFHPATAEDHEQEAFDRGRAFEVAWGRVSYQDRPSVAVAGIPMDESGVTRLIATLKRARKQAFGSTAHDTAINLMTRNLLAATSMPGVDPKPLQDALTLLVRERDTVNGENT